MCRSTSKKRGKNMRDGKGNKYNKGRKNSTTKSWNAVPDTAKYKAESMSDMPENMRCRQYQCITNSIHDY